MVWNSIKMMRTMCAINHNYRAFSRLFSRAICQHHLLHTQKIDSIPCGHLVNSKCFVRNNHVIHMRGLDWEAKEQDVIDFFKPLNVAPSKISLKCDMSGRISGLCVVEFATQAEALVAMRKKNAFIGNRFIRLSLKSTSDAEDGLSGERNAILESSATLKNIGETENSTQEDSFSTGHFIRISNLPTRITEQAIFQFFWPLNVRPTSVQPVHDENGYRTGEFDVEFLTHEDALKAMSKNNTCIGHRYIEFTLYSDISPVPRPPAYDRTTTNAKHPSDCKQPGM